MSKSSPASGISRRKFLESTAAAMAATTISGPLLGAQAVPAANRQPTLIRTENGKPGSADWQLTRVRVDRTTPRGQPGARADGGIRCPAIEGYCSHQSVRAGDRLDIMVSTNPPAAFTI